MSKSERKREAQIVDAPTQSISDTMHDSWEVRAKSDPLYAIDARRRSWSIDDFYSGGRQLVEEIVDPVIDIMSIDPTHLRVLEIGCGMGRLFEGLASRFAEVWGIDVSESMIEQGRAECPARAIWVVGDGVSLNGIEDESIDHVLSYEVFGHIPYVSVIEGYFNEIWRVLRPGGTFQVQMVGASVSRRQEVVRRMPRPFRVASGVILRKIGILPVRGDIDTWLACTVPPSQSLSMISTVGFIDGAALASNFDTLHEQAPAGYWVLGRKSGPTRGSEPSDIPTSFQGRDPDGAAGIAGEAEPNQ
jgi:SAM-dependent methyltransferase